MELQRIRLVGFGEASCTTFALGLYSRADSKDRAMTFAGVRPVLHTPFGHPEREPILEPEIRRLVSTMAAAGVAGVVVLGLASEAWAITEAERELVVGAVVDELAGSLPVVVGIDGAPRIACERSRLAAAAGAMGLMVLPPPSARSPSAVVSHFAAVADASNLPILMQDSPQVTGVGLELATILAIAAAHPLVVALKVELPGAGVKTSAAHAAGIEIVAGWGGLQYLESIRRGAIGCMPGCDLGPALVRIDGLARAGDVAAADSLYRAILPLLSYEAQSLDLLVLGAKHHLRRLGIFSTERLRSPGRSLDPDEAATIDMLLDRLAADAAPGFGLAGAGLVES
jgi:2-keto-3-deoxy-L-arabinonate dehydratase